MFVHFNTQVIIISGTVSMSWYYTFFSNVLPWYKPVQIVRIYLPCQIIKNAMALSNLRYCILLLKGLNSTWTMCHHLSLNVRVDYFTLLSFCWNDFGSWLQCTSSQRRCFSSCRLFNVRKFLNYLLCDTYI